MSATSWLPAQSWQLEKAARDEPIHVHPTDQLTHCHCSWQVATAAYHCSCMVQHGAEDKWGCRSGQALAGQEWQPPVQRRAGCAQPMGAPAVHCAPRPPYKWRRSPKNLTVPETGRRFPPRHRSCAPGCVRSDGAPNATTTDLG